MQPLPPEAYAPPTEPQTGPPTTPSWRRFPLWGWIPYLVLGVLAGIWAATHWGAVVSGARSIKAIGFGAAAVVLAVLLLVVVARLARRGWAGQLAGLLPLIAAAVIAVLPSYVTTTVNDAAPDGLVAASETSSSAPPTTEAAPTTEPDGGVQVGSGPPVTTASPTTAPTTTEASSAPVELGTASFQGIDHDITGVARLIQLQDGSYVVRFEQFDVEPGPDYDVYLLAGDNVQSPGGGLALGDLRGTKGDQNYAVAAGSVAAGQPVTVLIWCELFDVPVANATITL